MALSIDVTWAKRVAKAILLIRVLVGWVFLAEGIQKFLFPDSLGAGRFVKIGIPWPHVVAPFVGVVELCVARFIVDRPSHSAFAGASSYRYCRRAVLDQDCHLRQERILEHLA